MIRFCLRFLGLLLLAAGFAALVVDGTRAVAADAWSFSSLASTLAALSPDAVGNLLHRLPADWRPGAETALRASPTAVVLGVAGLLLFVLTARRVPLATREGWGT